MRVFVIFNDSKTYEIEPTDTVVVLKKKIESVENIPPEGQRLIFKGTVLDVDERTISSYGVRHEETIWMVMKVGSFKVKVSCNEKGISTMVDITQKDNVRFIKNKIQEQFNIPASLQSYYHSGKMMVDEDCFLSKYNLVNGDSLILKVNDDVPEVLIQSSLSRVQTQLSNVLIEIDLNTKGLQSLDKLKKNYEELLKEYNKIDKALMNLYENLKKTSSKDPEHERISLEIKSLELKIENIKASKDKLNYDCRLVEIKAKMERYNKVIQEIEEKYGTLNKMKDRKDVSIRKELQTEGITEKEAIKTLDEFFLDYSEYDTLKVQRRVEEMNLGNKKKSLLSTEKQNKILLDSKDHNLKVIKNQNVSVFERKKSTYQLSTLIVPTQAEINKTNEIISNPQINEEHKDFPMRALSIALSNGGVTMFLSDRDPDIINLSTTSIVNGHIFDTVESATFPETDYLKFDDINEDESKKETFLGEFRAKVSRVMNLNPSNVQIISVERGSIKIIYVVIDGNGQEVRINDQQRTQLSQEYRDQVQLQVHPLFRHCQLNSSCFDPKYNFDFRNHPVESHQRGPRGNTKPYFQPRGWKRFALKVLNIYDDGNNDWLAMNNNPNEWYVAFHGLKNPSISLNPILNQGILPGPGQSYEHELDQNGHPCGRGTYLSDKIETSEGYTGIVQINGSNYKVAFQCRVHPSHVKIPRSNQNYWIVNDSRHIRPYGILIKKV